jgi:hypothetical protein
MNIFHLTKADWQGAIQLHPSQVTAKANGSISVAQLSPALRTC